MITMDTNLENLQNQKYKYGFTTAIEADQFTKGLDENLIRNISAIKNEPEFMLEFRLKAFAQWNKMKEPKWSRVHYPAIDFQDIIYYSAPKSKMTPDGKTKDSLDEVDPEILRTYEKLGIPIAEQKQLQGIAVDAIFDSVSVANTHKKALAEIGIIFCSISEAVQEHPDLIKKYLGTIVPHADNFYAALNGAVFSDGTFIYIPPNTKCPIELSTNFRINT
ncbi:MAG: Fe-S cluster assembly protein SufB, partial [Candidatus Melainabacteria bacterium]|nr:Fe-S cluster assembly protein SufB [Candidatus Melainabacteria bacterium]